MHHQPLIEIVDRAADFIAIADAEERVTYLNPSARAMVGMPPTQDATSTRLSDYHPAWVANLLLNVGLPEARRAGSWKSLAAGDRDQSKLRELTPRMREVLQLIAEDKHMKEVAAILGISHRTVEFHKYRIMQILGAKTNAELVRYAIKHGLVQAP